MAAGLLEELLLSLWLTNSNNNSTPWHKNHTKLPKPCSFDDSESAGKRSSPAIAGFGLGGRGQLIIFAQETLMTKTRRKAVEMTPRHLPIVTDNPSFSALVAAEDANDCFLGQHQNTA